MLRFSDAVSRNVSENLFVRLYTKYLFDLCHFTGNLLLCIGMTSINFET